ncbi:hypothetical protein [Bathymodiolus platifrons methanotrophic gill symbiont]|uniref:hypothetical protein n=1 Tax=Bathymodiolus platifrons methanotrophic gill symbiont TaxID=113268 RepID=UPI000B41F5C5|nr:hypothetical protein [Bathymodiolus platifrons methanotrophic gill symbiont]
MTVEVVRLIETGIRLDWSPEQVSGWLEKEENIRISHELIYQHVWADKRQGGELYKCIVSLRYTGFKKLKGQP